MGLIQIVRQVPEHHQRKRRVSSFFHSWGWGGRKPYLDLEVLGGLVFPLGHVDRDELKLHLLLQQASQHPCHRRRCGRPVYLHAPHPFRCDLFLFLLPFSTPTVSQSFGSNREERARATGSKRISQRRLRRIHQHTLRGIGSCPVDSDFLQLSLVMAYSIFSQLIGWIFMLLLEKTLGFITSWSSFYSIWIIKTSQSGWQ